MESLLPILTFFVGLATGLGIAWLFRSHLVDSFKALSADALRNNRDDFISLTKESLGQHIKPLKESLDKVEEYNREMEKDRAGAYSGLSEQVKNLLTTTAGLQSETANLGQALRNTNVRGQWGEMQLKRAVEFAGMVEYCDFLLQETTDTDEGRLRPDMIVRLPNSRQIIIDAKAPLSAFLDAIETTNADDRKKKLEEHATQVRRHIKQLSSKEYWKQFESTPEFVVLFLPGEAFFSAAVELEPELIEFGVKQNVILASPTTLIALLKAVAYGWREEKIAANAEKVSILGRELYERMKNFAEYFGTLGKHLDRAVDAYNKTVRSTETRLMVTARKFKELGAGTNEDIETPETIEKTAISPVADELTEENSD